MVINTFKLENFTGVLRNTFKRAGSVIGNVVGGVKKPFRWIGKFVQKVGSTRPGVFEDIVSNAKRGSNIHGGVRGRAFFMHNGNLETRVAGGYRRQFKYMLPPVSNRSRVYISKTRFLSPRLYHPHVLMTASVLGGVTLGLMNLGLRNRVDSAYQSAVFRGASRRDRKRGPTGDLVFALHRVR